MSPSLLSPPPPPLQIFPFLFSKCTIWVFRNRISFLCRRVSGHCRKRILSPPPTLHVAALKHIKELDHYSNGSPLSVLCIVGNWFIVPLLMLRFNSQHGGARAGGGRGSGGCLTLRTLERGFDHSYFQGNWNRRHLIFRCVFVFLMHKQKYANRILKHFVSCPALQEIPAVEEQMSHIDF